MLDFLSCFRSCLPTSTYKYNGNHYSTKEDVELAKRAERARAAIDANRAIG
jgi:hypothetical protein